jgi:leishmanolysin
MPRYETYRSRANASVAAARAIAEPFGITIRFIGGLTESQKEAFKKAADRWTRVIVGDLPDVVIEGEDIDDVLILAEGADIDGPGEILGQAGPTHLRPAAAGGAAYLPARGQMQFDTADLEEMEALGTLDDVITHEMGHVLGIGTVWRYKALLAGASTSDPTFVGVGAMAEYAVLRGLDGQALAVPVEGSGGVGTRDSHWRESVFQNELMSGYIAGAGNPLSRVTVASLADLGYLVDLDAAEPYELPGEAAERGLLVARERTHAQGTMLPLLPTVLPEDSLVKA